MIIVHGVLHSVRAKRITLMLLLCWGVTPASGQEKLQTPQETNERIRLLAAAQAHPSANPIGSGDLLHIDVFDVPDLSRDVRVSDGGLISLPLIPGRIQAGGLTTFQLQEKIADLLLTNGLVSHPQVSVFVKEQVSEPVSVVGAVRTPTVYQVIRPTTLLEVLAHAGGIADDAGSSVMVTRSVASSASNSTDPMRADAPQTITIRLRDLLDSGDPAFNIPVYGGDVISVPRAGIVYVAGAVQAPGGFVLQNPGDQMTTLKALTLAHGLLSTSKASQAVIIRMNPDTGEKKEIDVDLKKIMARKAEDVRLTASDILFVPDSGGKKALYRAGEAALSVTTGLVLLRAGRY